VLSTAGSFSPPVGSHLSGDGYYLDFSVKADEPAWPAAWLEPREEQLHVATAQLGLGCYERYLSRNGDEWLDTAIKIADYLVDDQAPDGGWPHLMPMPHSYWLRAPWLSAMAQGEGASLLARVGDATGEARYGAAAIRALEPMRVPSRAGGVRAELDGGFFPEEYPSDPSSYVLNGAIFALWGCRDVAIRLGDEGASALYAEGIETLARNIDRYDTGYWSMYDLYPHPVRNVARGAYHRLHLNQLRALQQVSPRDEFAAIISRFEAYENSRACAARATAEKIAFRLAVPRNAKLAMRMPWSPGPNNGEVLVLCYHAVSDTWPSRLAVTSEQLREQIATLLERGYEPVTFTEAVLSDAGSKRLAVTFDDAYDSLRTHAAPVLAKLGVPATVFVPTDFAGRDGPMAWPGIDEWLTTPHSGELTPLDWDGLRELADSGWEVGSHTRSHPRLTELPDILLAAELTESRTEIEQHLDRPCLSIAYPYGDVDERVIAAARDAGYTAGAALPTTFEQPRRLSWPRVGIYRADTGLPFNLKVSRAVRRLRRSPAWSMVEGLSRARGARAARQARARD
jgi:peptidoglycan/xylan/chitin deacetylase (PgdA/CDA1 family)